MPLTNRTHQALLNSLFGKTSNFGVLASAPTVYVALSTTLPTMAGGNVTEPAGATADDYARVATAASDWVAATSADPSVVQNANEIAFPELVSSGEAWGTVTHFVLYDAATAGNVLGWGALTASRTPVLGDLPRFAAGALSTRLGS